MSINSKIGIFDTGAGGLSVWKEIVELFPRASTVYFGDSLNCPYGERDREEILELSEKIVDFLIERECGIIVIACNTITTTVINTLRSRYNIPFVGIEPAVKVAALNTVTGKIGVLATRGTFNGELYNNTKSHINREIEVFFQPGDGLVEAVESGTDADFLVRKYVKFFLDKEVDQIVLGCTHYPFLSESIKREAGSKAEIINPAKAVALQTGRILGKMDMIKPESDKSSGQHTFFTSGKNFPLYRLIPEAAKLSTEIITDYVL